MMLPSLRPHSMHAYTTTHCELKCAEQKEKGSWESLINFFPSALHSSHYVLLSLRRIYGPKPALTEVSTHIVYIYALTLPHSLTTTVYVLCYVISSTMIAAKFKRNFIASRLTTKWQLLNINFTLYIVRKKEKVGHSCIVSSTLTTAGWLQTIV